MRTRFKTFRKWFWTVSNAPLHFEQLSKVGCKSFFFRYCCRNCLNNNTFQISIYTCIGTKRITQRTLTQIKTIIFREKKNSQVVHNNNKLLFSMKKSSIYKLYKTIYYYVVEMYTVNKYAWVVSLTQLFPQSSIIYPRFIVIVTKTVCFTVSLTPKQQTILGRN